MLDLQWIKMKTDTKIEIKKRDLNDDCPKPKSYIWLSILKFDTITLPNSHLLLFPKDSAAGSGTKFNWHFRLLLCQLNPQFNRFSKLWTFTFDLINIFFNFKIQINVFITAGIREAMQNAFIIEWVLISGIEIFMFLDFLYILWYISNIYEIDWHDESSYVNLSASVIIKIQFCFIYVSAYSLPIPDNFQTNFNTM